MSDEKKDIMEWFKTNYPLERYVLDEISNHVTKILGEIKTPANQIPLDFYALKHNGKLAFAAKDLSLMFIGAFAKVVIDIISKNLESNISTKLNQQIEEKAKEAVKGYMKRATPMLILQDFKRCTKCGLDNDYKNKFCSECGTKLPEKS